MRTRPKLAQKTTNLVKLLYFDNFYNLLCLDCPRTDITLVTILTIYGNRGSYFICSFD
jgi:hypothetical protein